MAVATQDRLDATFAALANATRRAILARLAEGEANVNQLAEPFQLSLPAISKHIKVLERAGSACEVSTRSTGRAASIRHRSKKSPPGPSSTGRSGRSGSTGWVPTCSNSDSNERRALTMTDDNRAHDPGDRANVRRSSRGDLEDVEQNPNTSQRGTDRPEPASRWLPWYVRVGGTRLLRMEVTDAGRTANVVSPASLRGRSSLPAGHAPGGRCVAPSRGHREPAARLHRRDVG